MTNGREESVDDDQEFAETLTPCELLPDPNIVGITVCVGSKLRGSLGVVAAACHAAPQ